MNSWLRDITTALENLGGVAHYADIYEAMRELRTDNLPKSWKKIIQRTIQDHSADSEGYKGQNIFRSVDGIGVGVWALRSHLSQTPVASDIEELSTPERILTETYRILRDTELARNIKALHKNTCQICGETITLKNGKTYAEAHHLRPLGMPHNGPDVKENILVLCPNHHVMLDYGALWLEVAYLHLADGHLVSSSYIDYHNGQIFNGHAEPRSNG